MAFEWQKGDPAEHGLDAGRLAAMEAELAQRGTKAFFVARNDRVVWEYYADGHGADVKHHTASLAKALVGGASLMFAMADGLIDPDHPASDYVPEWRDDPTRSEITVRHLATHSSGVQDAEIYNKAHEDLPGWMGAFWRKDPDPFTISRDDAPTIFRPGTDYHYSNPGMAMLAYVVTASLKGQSCEDIRSLLRTRMMEPLGVVDEAWSCGYGQTYEVNGLPLVANWGGGGYTARAVASIARLMLRKGDWDGVRLVEPTYVDQVLADAGTPVPRRPDGNTAPVCGLGWYTNSDGNWANVPTDAFAGAGAGNQVLMASPSLNLIVVRNGSVLEQGPGRAMSWRNVERYLFDPLMDTLE